ncbi:hypothetical protein [Halobacillus massiliensis]|uniref:hypothetical protein n=1 Tax=Halobacillus massiliensis TaxID=1926286 RepID=UPI0009E3D3A3|nr:hypothetical protein [Halobacillus massiliensis]
MNKKLIAAFIVGIGLVIFTVIYTAGGKSENASNDNKENIADIKTNVNEESPEVVDHEEDKDPEVVKETKELAHEFIKHYAALNPKEPMEYLPHVKEITDADLYTKLSNSPRRPTAASHKRIVKELEIYPVDDNLPERKKWNVIAIMDVYNSEGEKRTEEDSYLVSVAKDDEWKVTGFKVGY